MHLGENNAEIQLKIQRILDFYFVRLMKNYSSHEEQLALNYFRYSIALLEFLIVVYSHGGNLNKYKKLELWNLLLKLGQQNGWQTLGGKGGIGFVDRIRPEKDSPFFVFISSKNCYEFLQNFYREMPNFRRFMVDQSNWEVKDAEPSIDDLNGLEARLKPYIENYKFPPHQHSEIQASFFQEFEKSFKTNIHLKIVCVDVESRSQILLNTIGEAKQSRFESQVFEEHTKLSFFIRKTEYAGKGKFKNLYIFVFNQQANLTPKSYFQSIERIWFETEGKGFLESITFLNPLLTSLQMSSGTIEQSNSSYKCFVGGVLNYIFTVENYFSLTMVSSNENYLISKLVDLGPRLYKNPNEIKKELRKKRSPRKIEHRTDFNEKNYEWEKSLKLTKPLIKQQKDIKLLYSLLSDKDDAEENDLQEFLYKIDLMVLCAFKWKIPAFVVSDGSSAVKSGTEIGKVIADIDKAYKQKRRELILNAEYLGVRVGLFVIIFEYLGIEATTTDIISPGLNRYYFYNSLVDEINLIYLKPINELVPYLRKRIDEIRAKQSASYVVYEQEEPEPKFFSTLLKKLSRLFEQKINRSTKSDLTLKDWYSTQIRSRQNSYENLVRYSRQCRSDQTKDIVVDIEFALTNDSELDINFFHVVLTKGIDLFSRTDFAKEAIRGYWGVWESISFQNQQCDAHVSLMFFMDQRYVARQEELRDELNKALEKAVASPYKNWDKANELRFNFKEYLCFQALGEELFYKPASDRKKIEKEIERSLHMEFYLALHRDLYWLPSELILKQRVIRGREGYKPRRKSSKPKALK